MRYMIIVGGIENIAASAPPPGALIEEILDRVAADGGWR
jgi:hypothetical protein